MYDTQTKFLKHFLAYKRFDLVKIKKKHYLNKRTNIKKYF